MAHQWRTDEDMASLPGSVHCPVDRVAGAKPVAVAGHYTECLGIRDPRRSRVPASGRSSGRGIVRQLVAFLISIAGVIVCLGGFALLRGLAFPLLVTLFMLPKLAILYNQATLPLQLLASRMAAGMLTVSGAGVIRDGNIVERRRSPRVGG